MADAIDPDNPDRLLAAFADGELDVAQGLAALRYVSGSAEAAAKVDGQIRFRQAVGRAMRQTPAPSAGLRESLNWLKVESDADSEQGAPAVVAAPPAPARSRWFIGPALPMAAAASVAFLLIGLSAGYVAFKPHPTPAGPVPATYVTDATKIHVNCSRFPDLHKGGWPVELNDLGPPLVKYLGGGKPYPDLRPLGFEYLGSGPCGLHHAAHVLYRSTKPSSAETISLFVQRDDEHQVHVEEGKSYRAAPTDSATPAHPVLIWRHDNMVFYLVGDAEESVRDAARTMKVPTSV